MDLIRMKKAKQADLLEIPKPDYYVYNGCDVLIGAKLSDMYNDSQTRDANDDNSRLLELFQGNILDNVISRLPAEDVVRLRACCIPLNQYVAQFSQDYWYRLFKKEFNPNLKDHFLVTTRWDTAVIQSSNGVHAYMFEGQDRHLGGRTIAAIYLHSGTVRLGPDDVELPNIKSGLWMIDVHWLVAKEEDGGRLRGDWENPFSLAINLRHVGCEITSALRLHDATESRWELGVDVSVPLAFDITDAQAELDTDEMAYYNTYQISLVEQLRSKATAVLAIVNSETVSIVVDMSRLVEDYRYKIGIVPNRDLIMCEIYPHIVVKK